MFADGLAATAAATTKKLQMEIFGIRILAVLMTWEVQVAIVPLQMVVTLIEGNDLQVWCRQCVFGTQPPDKRWNEQRKALESAIREVL
ncbi:hypothetical protein QLG07_06110 [Erwinia sp. V90_4]|uniref:hypothetical protein n=1 Tax=Erwinia TaxID=551 RepID=UPI001D49F6A5|nr:MULTISPECIES: hypothetical protein [Erwinia]MDI3439019.1 hypothetical protein [Erwinia sp. V90_4]CAH0135821.1 hypothetical protein SRABI13_00157 [Erwinia aphidicola]